MGKECEYTFHRGKNPQVANKHNVLKKKKSSNPQNKNIKKTHFLEHIFK